MCGIAGVRRFGKDPIRGEELVLLLCSLEHRGKHATGIALVNPDGIHVYKAAMPAWRFTKSKEFEEFINTHLIPETETALLHTRWATTGSPEFNQNNHPMFDGETAIVHNGMISNYDWLFKGNEKYQKSCETDSDIIRAILSEHGFNEKGVRELCKMAGSAAIACVSTKFPHRLLLARSGSPLVYGFTPDGDKLYWASEAEAIIRAARPFHLVRGVWVQNTKADVKLGHMPDNSAWMFDDKQIEFHHKFDVCTYYRKPDYSRGRESYHTKVRNWKSELKKQIKKNKSVPRAPMQEVIPPPKQSSFPPRVDIPLLEAPKNDLVGSILSCPGCGAALKNSKGIPWKDLQCSGCKSSLVG